MKALKAILMGVLLVLAATSVVAQTKTIPVLIEETEIDGTEVTDGNVNILDLERDNEFSLRLRLFATQDAEDVEIRAFISGYEHNDVESISDMIGPFDFEANVTYVKKMTLTLPANLDQDDYKLRVIISDRFGFQSVANYDLRINTDRHDIRVQDIVLNPGTSVKAGQALLVSARVENMGQKDEEDVKVTASIADLGVSAAGYIDEVESEDEEQTEELFIRLPKCAEAGEYQMTLTAEYNDGKDKVTMNKMITVLENEDCKEAAPVVVMVEQTNDTAQPAPSSGKVRAALEIILLVLVALLVIVGLIIGFSRMREE